MANMKSSVTFIFIVICTVVLAAKQSQAKKGCNAYGMACYGGHGKRSLGSLLGLGLTGNGNLVVPAASSSVVANGSEQDELRPGAILQVVPVNDDSSTDYEPYPRYRLMKVIKSWFGGHPIRRNMEHFNEMDYPVLSAEGTPYNRENALNTNNNNNNNNNNAFN